MIRRTSTRAVVLALLGPLVGSTAAADPSPTDARIAHFADEARTAKGAAAYVALREMWRLWEQVDPAQIEAALDGVENDAGVAPEVRAYAGMVRAYAMRRRGDLDGASRKIRKLGFIERWLVVGPFDNEAKASLLTPFGPEDDLAAPVVLGRSYEGKERPVHWRAMPDVFTYGWIDLDDVLRPAEKVCAYVTAFARSKRGSGKAKAKRQASIWCGASGAFRVFVGGEEVLADPAYRSLDADRWAAKITLEPGWNRITAKVCGDEEGPMFELRLADANGAPDADLETTADVSASEEAAKNAPKKAAIARDDKGVRVVSKGDPYAKGATNGAPSRGAPPPFSGALAGLDRIAASKSPRPEELEAYARYLAITGGDDKSQHVSRDLASRAADLAPNVGRLLLAAELAEDRNDRAAWVKKARAAVKTADEDAEVTLAEALLARSGTNFRDATPYFDKLLAHDPANVAGVLGRAELYDEAGLKRSALVTLEEAARRLPHSVSILRALARQYRAVGRSSDADDVERRVSMLQFDDVAYLRSRVELAVARRDSAAATRWLDRLLDLEPDSYATTEFAARAFRAAGEPARAFALLDKRLDLAPEDVDAMRLLADFYGEDGRHEEQLKLLRKILVLRPQAKDVREYVEHAQPPKIRRDEAFAWDKEQILKLAKEAPAGGFPRRTLRDLRVTTVFANGLASRFYQIAFQPLTDEAAAAARQYAFSYQSGREVVDVRAARVYRQNGQVDEAIQTGDGPADNPGLAMYTSSRTFYVELPRLQPGDVVELRYRIEEVTPRNEFGDSFSETVYLQSTEPVASEEYVLITPSARKMQMRLPQLPGFTTEDKTEGEDRVFRLSGTSIPPLLVEPSAPPLLEQSASVSVSTFATWEDVGKWYWGLAKDQFDADDEVRKKVRELTKGKKTDEEKIRAVYDFVVQRTRYVALEFGIEGFKPRRCAQTLGRGWGDCKDKATVIVTMLRELGIPASIVLVRSGLRGDAPPDPPSYSFFDHAIAYVPKLDLFLDGTAEYTGMNELPPFDRGEPGLIVSEGGVAKLVRLPDPPAEATARTRKIDVAIPDAGPAQLDLRLETTGAFAAEYRQRYHAVATQRGRIVEDMGAEFGGLGATEKGIEVNDLENIEQPVKLHVKGKALGIQRSNAGDLSFVAAPSLSLVARYASLSQRHADVKLPFAYSLDDEWTVRLPAGASFRHVPEAKHIESPFGRLDLNVVQEQGRLVEHVVLRLDKTRVSPAEYAAFRAFCEDVDKAIGDRVVVTK